MVALDQTDVEPVADRTLQFDGNRFILLGASTSSIHRSTGMSSWGQRREHTQTGYRGRVSPRRTEPAR